jgi:16S rRNA (guanine966-N2)-methyltransferase
MRAAGTNRRKRQAALRLRDARRWKPHILSGAPLPVVLAERPGWTPAAPVVTLALQLAHIDGASTFTK